MQQQTAIQPRTCKGPHIEVRDLTTTMTSLMLGYVSDVLFAFPSWTSLAHEWRDRQV
jgi:hypothetical protein